MQQPPPGPPEGGSSEPPPSQPPPMQPPPPSEPPPPMTPPPPMYSQPQYQSPPAAGMSRQTGSLIAYVLGWLSGVVMLFVSQDQEVKFNAAQSIVFFGGLTVIDIILGFIPVIHYATFLVDLFGFVAWIILLIRVSQNGGNRVEVPLVGPIVAQYAEKLVGAAAA